MSILPRTFVLSKRIGSSLLTRNLLSVKFASTASVINDSPHDKNLAIVEKSIKEAESLSSKYNKHIEEAVVRWDKCNEIYYGKERDMTNFPTIKVADQHPKVRLGFIPDAWFQALYSRTGVTGPYLFLAGTTTLLLSKEIWVVDAHFVEILPFVAIMTWMIKKFGSRSSDYIDKFTQQRLDNFYTKPLKNAVANLDRTVQSSDEEIARAACVPMLSLAKKENLALQLEMDYRERLQKVYKTVTRRLDYHMERENVRRRFQQQHMANWISTAVVSGITPAQEKDTMRQCIEDLKAMSAQHRTASA